MSEIEYRAEHDPHYYVVKSNQIVQHTHFSMPLSDQKVLASLIRSIKPKQTDLKVTFSTKKYMKMLGLTNSGSNFADIMYSLKSISNDNFFIRHSDGSYDLWRWIDKIHADPNKKGNGNFIVTFPKELQPYLFNKSLKYRTIYRFSDIMLMKNRYSPRLYEIFRSNQSKQPVYRRGLNYSIVELRKALDLVYRNKKTGKIKHDKKGHTRYMYKQFASFNRRVLKPARREINKLTEFNVSFHRIKQGQKIVGINVVMVRKNKKQLMKRKYIIYFITHHIPKSQWKTWRKNVIEGKSRNVKNGKKQAKQDKVKKSSSSSEISQAQSSSSIDSVNKQATENKVQEQAEMIKKLKQKLLGQQSQGQGQSQSNQSSSVSQKSASSSSSNATNHDSDKTSFKHKKSTQQKLFENESYKTPWRIFNKNGAEFEYYNPNLKKNVWTTQLEHDKEESAYYQNY